MSSHILKKKSNSSNVQYHTMEAVTASTTLMVSFQKVIPFSSLNARYWQQVDVQYALCSSASPCILF